jgi:hypothetical protein
LRPFSKRISSVLTEAESKVWHAHPVWFLDDNPIVGYSKQKKGIRLMFWSGADFKVKNLDVKGVKFKDASIFYNNLLEINVDELTRWLKKSREIQWDYKNIVKRKGKLVFLKTNSPSAKNLKICKNGHQYYKSSDCPTCPVCEEGRKPKSGFLSLISAPSRRALERENIRTLKTLSNWSEKEIISLHGIGHSTIPKLKKL